MKGRSIIGIPWRIKFLSCCIVDILSDDVTRPGAVDCEEIGSVPIGVASKQEQHSNTQHTTHTHTHTHPLSLFLSLSHTPLHTSVPSPHAGNRRAKIVLTEQVLFQE